MINITKNYGIYFDGCHFEGNPTFQTIMTAPEAKPEAQQEEAAPVEPAETETVEKETSEANENGEQSIEDRIRQAIERMRAEGLFKNKYDYAWVMVAMREMTELPERLRFTIPCEFYAYMKEKIGLEDLPCLSSIQKAYTKGIDEKSLKYAETQRREGVKKRFISAFRKGI